MKRDGVFNMLLSVTAEYNSSPIVKMLEIDEKSGDVRISFVDTSDDNVLRELHEQLENGLSFADFQIIKSKSEDNLDAYELRHFCTNCAPGEPDLNNNNVSVKDSPSFVGFIRKLIVENGHIVLPLKNVPEQQDIPYWMTANASSVQFTEDMGIKVSHLIPGKELGYWRWSSSSILMADNRDEFGDVTGHLFLCSTEFEPGEYTPFLVEHESRRVLQENGTSVTYRVFSVTKELPIYTNKINVMVTPAIISRLKFAADSYKLALYSLSEGLFEDKNIESSWSERNAPLVTGRFLKIKNSTPVSKKTASAMLVFLLDSLSGKTTSADEIEFLKKYPHYQVYSAIIKSQIGIFHGLETTQSQKLRAYRSLKNTEAYYNLLLQECRYHVMFHNDAYLFNLWTANLSFNSDIPNYKVTISGGGGTWHPNASYFW